MNRKILLLCASLVVVFALKAVAIPKKQVKVLVFSKTVGFRHASIETGKLALLKLASLQNFSIDTTENANAFTEKNLKQYRAVIFLSTTGDVLNDAQQKAFEKYIQAGGGFVGIHAATDTEFDWPWFGKLVGAYFTNHPAVQTAKFIVKDRNHPSTSFFTDSVWMHKDELYNFKDINPANKTLITVDESSYKGGTNGSFHPFAWYHNFDGGRSFYTCFGHTKECWSDKLFLRHLAGGIQYAIDKRK
ncbi:ThuA domain-containing protein [Pedobacter sp. MW01-1-1]|uniref:ThuA domain-containing protein n=1 Tax=Pedobacter sp. MW01-1-1 TaxID=3383027 RepID=UPI003FEFF942